VPVLLFGANQKLSPQRTRRITKEDFPVILNEVKDPLPPDITTNTAGISPDEFGRIVETPGQAA
jgi:hypothetical protein